MIKAKIDKSAFMRGFGFYVVKKTWNLTDEGTWYGPSIALHVANRIFRVYRVVKVINADL